MPRRTAYAMWAALVVFSSAAGFGYTTYGRWPTAQATIFINPANLDLPAAATIAALQAAMDVWNTQAGTPFRFTYGGTVSDTTTANDNRNVVIFRNATNGSAYATTYSWWNGSNELLDSDVVFWDNGRTFYTGTSGCTGSAAAYVEDVAAHEFGHVLGLNHSGVTGATMKSSYSACSQTQRTLAPDDIAGAQALYPPDVPTNAVPTLVAVGSTVNEWQRVQLTWVGFATGVTAVDVYRNGTKVATPGNDGDHLDRPRVRGTGNTWVYRVCAVRSSVCTNDATVVF